ncbi:hypothetical protein ARC20_03325 [Stenotrophomonas panacihumi]|uniref:Uncharacterized protein n=1 Tax=Stenotrophomonas panacihumi TaxID=676599 RepID=A0A0R0AQ45_9GAMM|nr:hypothetical protein [Stenotrophomonas panacihumi]KRG47372.1 hypothetical protein ARC20_03325 [Stenotrophomonas panacihumi]PTN55851.1 hypothetical protein C9J98_04565 [Stenotrophomonas panacihumi]
MDAITLLREELTAMLADSPLPPSAPGELMHPPVDMSPAARKMRAIVRIADMYGWHSAITHFLDMKGTSYLTDLTLPQLDDLLGRMHGYVDAAETGSSLPDCLPAC